MKFCTKCGNKIMDDAAAFCGRCGNALEVPANFPFKEEVEDLTQEVAYVAPAEPAQPAEPVKPVAPAQPVVTVKPAEPVKPAAPVQPVVTVKPAEPVASEAKSLRDVFNLIFDLSVIAFAAMILWAFVDGEISLYSMAINGFDLSVDFSSMTYDSIMDMFKIPVWYGSAGIISAFVASLVSLGFGITIFVTALSRHSKGAHLYSAIKRFALGASLFIVSALFMLTL